FGISVFCFLVSEVFCQSTRADDFKKISFSPRSSRQADIKCVFFPMFESCDNFLRRSEKTETAGQIVSGAERKNAKRNSAIDESSGHLSDGAVAASGKHQIARFFEGLLVILFLR